MSSYNAGGIAMGYDEQRLRFMRSGLKKLNEFPEENKREIECLGWAIKNCQKNVDKKRSEMRRYLE